MCRVRILSGWGMVTWVVGGRLASMRTLCPEVGREHPTCSARSDQTRGLQRAEAGPKNGLRSYRLVVKSHMGSCSGAVTYLLSDFGQVT